jgi:hypothetical protein
MSMTRRRSFVSVIAGVACGVLVAVVACVSVFGQFIDVAPPRFPTPEVAEAVAVVESGKYRWPGTSVRVHEIDAQRFDVERRWLGMRESITRVTHDGGGWGLATPESGPGRAAQEVLACVVPGVAVGWLVTHRLRRRSASDPVVTPL